VESRVARKYGFRVKQGSPLPGSELCVKPDSSRQLSVNWEKENILLKHFRLRKTNIITSHSLTPILDTHSNLTRKTNTYLFHLS
jgi:hypothetical protein